MHIQAPYSSYLWALTHCAEGTGVGSRLSSRRQGDARALCSELPHSWSWVSIKEDE